MSVKIDNIIGKDSRLTDALRGLNSTKTRLPYEPNRDSQGYVFITRPQLNLTDVNLRNIREFYNLLTKDGLSIPSFVRHTLDPRLGVGNTGTAMKHKAVEHSSLVDKYNPFIPILSNTLTTLSGWPDPATPTHTSTAGIRKEQMAMVDGAYDIFDVFDLSATFENINNEPLTLLFQTWEKYASLTFEGMTFPYPDIIASNEFDYNTRIYRFVMDSKNKYIKKVAATGASFPTNSPLGKFFDYNAQTPYNDQTATVDIKFTCMGAIYNDPILFLEFNKLIYMFNPDIRDYLNTGDDSKIEFIPLKLREEYNFKCMPIIDLDTLELRWWISKNKLETE